MPVLRAVFSLIGIAVLCVMVVHGMAMAGYHLTDQDCPSVTEQDSRSSKSFHPSTCCTSIQCCPICTEPPCAASHVAASRKVKPLLNQPSPFLLVRAFHPPPKRQLS